MTDQELLNKILIGTYTMTDALRRIRGVRQFILNQLFASKISEFNAENSADAAWLSGLGADFYKEFTQSNVYSRVDNIEAELKKISPLVLYLPFEIPGGEIVRVGMKLRGSFGPNFLLEFRIDPNLIAGCALVWKNIYRDYSLRQKINDNREKILGMLKSELATKVLH